MRGIISKLLLGSSIAVSMAGCASTQATMMSKDVVKIDAQAGATCAEKTNELMMRRAGVETIRRGYDKYILVNHETGSVATGVTQYGHINRGGTGAVVVKMFKDDDPAGENALSARELLGPDWQKIASSKDETSCL